MTATAHALIGASLATSTSDPALGLTLAFLSHPLADMVPHWDFGFGWKNKSRLKLFFESVFDVVLGISLTYFIFGLSPNPLYLYGAVFLSLSWDFLEAPYWLFNWKFFPFKLIYQIQSGIQSRLGLPWGVVTQVITVLLFILTSSYLTS